MKTIIYIAGFVLLLTSQSAHGQTACPEEGTRRYNIESAVVTYTVTGRQEGSEILYFDRWGMREAKFSQVNKSPFGLQHIKTLIKEGWIFTLDYDKKIGKKEKDAFGAQYCADARAENSTFYKWFFLSLGGKKTGEADLLGRRCEVWYVERTGITYWLWNGVVLKTIIQAGSDTTEITAERIEEGAEISEETFLLPADFTFIEGDLNDIMISGIPRTTDTGACSFFCSIAASLDAAVSPRQQNT